MLPQLQSLWAERLMEIPFDSERKLMTTVNLIDGGKIAFTKGAMERLLPLCTHILWEGKEPLDDAIKERVISAYHTFMDTGLRVIAFAYKEIDNLEDVERDMVFAGLIGMEDPPIFIVYHP